MYKEKSSQQIHIEGVKLRINTIREYMNKHPKKYASILKFAEDNWSAMVNFANGPQAVSIADQIEMYTECPTSIAVDVARSMALLKSL